VSSIQQTIHWLTTIANSEEDHVKLPDYMRTELLTAAETIRDLDRAVDELIEERDEAFKQIDQLKEKHNG
jgi:predicted HAD superfamily phosphohydrolase